MPVDVHRIAEWITQSAAEWGERVQVPQAANVDLASDLARDAELPAGLTPGHLAWRSMATAGKHLGALHHIVSTTDNGVRVKPYLSLARATMLGAARALHVLEPACADGRRKHALQLLRAESEDLDRLVGDWENSAPGAEVAEMRRFADSFRADCERELIALGLKPRSMKAETQLLLDVAHHLQDGTPDPVASVMDVWRIASGTAHARTWPWDRGTRTRTRCTRTSESGQCRWGCWSTRGSCGTPVERRVPLPDKAASLGLLVVPLNGYWASDRVLRLKVR